MEGDEEDKGILEKEDISAVYKLKIIDNDEKCQASQVHLEKVKDKRIVFPQVRNIDQENDPIYETEKCVYVNPNSF